MKNIIIFYFIALAIVFIGIPAYATGGNPMDAPCFPELGFGTCNQTLSSGYINHLNPGEGNCPSWFPSAGCLELSALKPTEPQIIHLNYNESSHGYTCEYRAGCELDLSLI